jgi:hypothetical protein
MATSKVKEKDPIVELTIGGIDWKIRFSTQKAIRKTLGKDVSCYGYCEFDKQVITVDRNQTFSTLASTVFHEMVHAVLAPSHGTKASEEETVEEELAANLVGNMWVETLPYLPHLLSTIKNLSLPGDSSEEDV